LVEFYLDLKRRIMARHSFSSVIFDLDGVITRTALVHARAWKDAFDEYLRLREKRDGEKFKEFTHDGDYLPFVDGKPRYEGVRSFLESRGINISFGKSSDSADKETVCGIGNKKNAMFLNIIKTRGVKIYPSTVKLVKSLRRSGIKVGVASSSKSCELILKAAGIAKLFATRVDGVVSVQLGLKGKPEGDIFVTAARNLGSNPAESVVVEDATSGVMAGRNGGFGLVLGVARKNNESDLLENGADIVVRDLSAINTVKIEKWFKRKPKSLFTFWSKKPKEAKGRVIVNPSCLKSAASIFSPKKKLVFFLDYDGTLTPIVGRPEWAILSAEMRSVVRRLAKEYTVAIVSGRMRQDVENLVKIKGLFYAGSHGFDILGPKFSLVEPRAKKVIPLISRIIGKLKKELKGIPGALVEEKKFSVAVHYRLVASKHLAKIKRAVNAVIKKHTAVRLMRGKKVYEILPDIEWDKGKAIRWIMQALKLSWDQVSAIYIGDDTTDEYAFRTIKTRGTPVLVAKKPRVSAADFQLFSVEEVKKLFEKIIASKKARKK